MRLIRGAIVTVVACLVALPANAKEKAGGDRAQGFQTLVDCRSLTDSTARLDCYDRNVAALDAAEKAKDIIIVDRVQINEARHSLFGLTLPRINLFGGNGDELDRIEGTIVSAQMNDAGQMSLTLDDGAIWVQTDDFTVGRIKPGTKVTIKRGLGGSFFASVPGRPGFRAKRVSR